MISGMFLFPFFYGCQDDALTQPKSEPLAEIILESPIKDHEVETNEILRVSGRIVADFQMHGYEINIVRLDGDFVVDSKYEHNHKKEIELDFTWKNTLKNKQEMYVEIIAYLGHNNNEIKVYKRPFLIVGDR